MLSVWLATCLRSARDECVSALRGPLLPAMFVTLALYMTLVMLNADYMRSMGAIDVPRNAPHVAYLMASGQCLWLFFAWAWIFAQTVQRDQTARLHEVVLAAPVSLAALYLGRYLGALVVAILLATGVFAGLLATPLLASVGLIPPDAAGPHPWAAIGHSMVVFTVPTAAGVGALYMMAALRTRGATGPFIVAAVIALSWMVAMIALRGGEVSVEAASTLDPSGYAEAERQANAWTPREKRTAVLVFSDELLANRLLWVALPLVVLGFVLARLRRETLVRERRVRVGSAARGVRARGARGVANAAAATATRWWRACVLEWRWHVGRSMSGFGFLLALLLLSAMGVLGSWVNFVGHIDGPLVPYPEGLLPFIVEFFYLVIVFVTVGFVGVMVRRDGVIGLDECLDSTPAPLAVRVPALLAAALTLTLVLAAVPACAALVVTALGAPAAVNWTLPFEYIGLVMLPALAELTVAVVLLHALVRPAGLAYSASIFIAFVAVVNHELGVVEYPPAQFGVPPHADLSELVGWSPWWRPLAGMGLMKLTVGMLFGAAAWLAWRRGTDQRVRVRWRAAGTRLLGPPGIIAAASAALLLGLGWLLHDRLAVDGEYESIAGGLTADADWEAAWWDAAAGYTVAGGRVSGVLVPGEGRGEFTWWIDGLRVRDGRLHARLPHGVDVNRARVGDRPVALRTDEDHLVIELPMCRSEDCDLELVLALRWRGWTAEEVPWFDASGVWLRAEDVLPALGHDPRRLVRASADRVKRGLPSELPAMPDADSLVPLRGVAPHGNWSWRVEVKGGAQLGGSGQTTGQLDFALAWLPERPSSHAANELLAWVGASRASAAPAALALVAEQARCVSTELGRPLRVANVLQAPRGLGEVRLFDDVLWLPEDQFWDAAGAGAGGHRRAFQVARALAFASALGELDLREEPGARWFANGIAGRTALRCLNRTLGQDAEIEQRTYMAEAVVEAFGTLAEPVVTIVDAHGDWIADYAGLALDGWWLGDAAPEPAALIASLDARLAQGPGFAKLFTTLVGESAARRLLGPPLVSDVALIRDGTGDAISARRWTWSDGGWSNSPPPQVVFSRANGRSAQVSVGPTTAALAVESRGYLLDGWPSFERSMADNRPRPESQSGGATSSR
ncbi:MAG: hypothetical protein AAF515_03315 [Pseudomonadota bacterium]